MLTVIDAALARRGGALSRGALTALVGKTALDNEIRAGHLVRVAPSVYARPWAIDDPTVREVAAIRYASPGGLLSHTSALRRCGLFAENTDLVHVTVPELRRLRGVPTGGGLQVVVHRSRRPHSPTLLGGAPCVPLPAALLGSWSLGWSSGQGAAGQMRNSVITAVRRRLTSPTDLRTEIGEAPNCAGRSALNDLVSLLDAGCESELEIWGYGRVFDVPELRGGRWQHPVRTPTGWRRIDLAYPDAQLAVELDGRQFHASAAQWERDIARDLELAKLGWQTIRFSHHRLTHQPRQCQRDAIAVLNRRRR